MNKSTILMATILFFVLVSSSVSAISVGVSPGKVQLNNMLKGGYAERDIRISTNAAEPVVARFTLDSEVRDWIRFEPANNTFLFSQSDPHVLKIIVETPEDARSDTYRAQLNIVTERYGNISGRAGGFVKAGVAVIIDIVVSDDQLLECRAGGFSLSDIEEGFPLEVKSTVENRGNVRINPLIVVDIWDQSKENIVFSREFQSGEVLPTTKKKVIQDFSHNLPIGQYWSEIKIEQCKANDFITFSVVEKGGILDKGVLERIMHKQWALVDEPVEIAAIFRNDGPRTVSAKFKGDIRLDNNIIQVIDTEEIDIPSSQKSELTTFFTPTESGRYVVSGQVLYNRKLTFEKSSILNVNYALIKEGGVRLVPLLIYIAIIITILFLIRKIMKDRKKRKPF